MRACVVVEIPEDEVEYYETLEYFDDPQDPNAEKAMLLRQIAVYRHILNLANRNAMFYYTKDLME